VRAPVEFAQGAFPGAINLPILNDAERKDVGIAHKQKGPEAAVALGYNLVSGTTKDSRIQAWLSFIEEHPEAHLYCFRGGQRSRIATQWLEMHGRSIPRIEGGYKAMRRFLIDRFDQPRNILLLGGQTGCGKTRLLWRVRNALNTVSVVDLEALAHHRGSAFGPRPDPQPPQINFENALAIDLMKCANQPVLMEDEGRMIGRLNIPQPLQTAMKAAPLLVLTATDDERVEITWQEYIVDQFDELTRIFGEDKAHLHHRNMLLSSLDAITKRLGGVRHRELRQTMNAGFDAQELGDLDLHRDWIRRLLTEYYDPMYDYQLSQKTDRVVFTGSQDEILTWLDSDGIRSLADHWH
ncbi:MAG: tRNA 2-selenouridine(34) synthase MnmH, partial [Pseudomonadota bacterium]